MQYISRRGTVAGHIFEKICADMSLLVYMYCIICTHSSLTQNPEFEFEFLNFLLPVPGSRVPVPVPAFSTIKIAILQAVQVAQ